MVPPHSSLGLMFWSVATTPGTEADATSFSYYPSSGLVFRVRRDSLQFSTEADATFSHISTGEDASSDCMGIC